MKAAVLREFGAIENSPLEIIEVDRLLFSLSGRGKNTSI